MNIPSTIFISPNVIHAGFNYWFQEFNHIKTKVNETSIKKTICKILKYDYSKIEKISCLSIFKNMKYKDMNLILKTLKKEYDIKIKKRYNITHEQLQILNDSNLINIGAHTLNHPILLNETDLDAEKEIRESIEKLSLLLNRDIKHFAYPNGIFRWDYSDRELKILKNNNIKLAFSMNIGSINRNSKPLNIPRLGFSELKNENQFRYILKKFFVLTFLRNNFNYIFFKDKEIKEREEIYNLKIKNNLIQY